MFGGPLPVSNEVILMNTHSAGKNALDEFLPESVFTPEVRGRGEEPAIAAHLFLSPDDVQLDPIEVVSQSPTAANSASVQLWPMLAAALVAIGVSMLALAVFEKFGVSAL